jgi:hypothetical protein
MLKTGKLYTLTLVSAFLLVISSGSVFLWNFNTSKFHLWFDVVPSGLGMSSLTTTLIVVSFRIHRRLSSPYVLMIGGPGRKCYNRGCGCCNRVCIPFPDDRASAGGQLERGATSNRPHEAASDADHRARLTRGSTRILPLSFLTI